MPDLYLKDKSGRYQGSITDMPPWADAAGKLVGYSIIFLMFIGLLEKLWPGAGHAVVKGLGYVVAFIILAIILVLKFLGLLDG